MDENPNVIQIPLNLVGKKSSESNNDHDNSNISGVDSNEDIYNPLIITQLNTFQFDACSYVLVSFNHSSNLFLLKINEIEEKSNSGSSNSNDNSSNINKSKNEKNNNNNNTVSSNESKGINLKLIQMITVDKNCDIYGLVFDTNTANNDCKNTNSNTNWSENIIFYSLSCDAKQKFNVTRFVGAFDKEKGKLNFVKFEANDWS